MSSGRPGRHGLPRLIPSVVWLVPTGLEVRDHAPRQEPPGSLPAPPQMPLPEIPQPWLVSEPRVRSRNPGRWLPPGSRAGASLCQPDSGRKGRDLRRVRRGSCKGRVGGPRCSFPPEPAEPAEPAVSSVITGNPFLEKKIARQWLQSLGPDALSGGPACEHLSLKLGYSLLCCFGDRKAAFFRRKM